MNVNHPILYSRYKPILPKTSQDSIPSTSQKSIEPQKGLEEASQVWGTVHHAQQPKQPLSRSDITEITRTNQIIKTLAQSDYPLIPEISYPMLTPQKSALHSSYTNFLYALSIQFLHKCPLEKYCDTSLNLIETYGLFLEKLLQYSKEKIYPHLTKINYLSEENLKKVETAISQFNEKMYEKESKNPAQRFGIQLVYLQESHTLLKNRNFTITQIQRLKDEHQRIKQSFEVQRMQLYSWVQKFGDIRQRNEALYVKIKKCTDALKSLQAIPTPDRDIQQINRILEKFDRDLERFNQDHSTTFTCEKLISEVNPEEDHMNSDTSSIEIITHRR